MHLKIIHSIRANNFNDEHVMQKINDMWKNASPELSEHKDNIYGLYHEYESDYKGDYTLSVAIEGTNVSSIKIPNYTTYEVFKVETDSKQGIFNTWSDIWNMEKEGQLERAYTYDFEKYKPDGDIEIYIAVKGK
ncbi:effector binding domain-containing protein [Virgibacillus sp. MSJ-26]|uniref:GyrI-like domain-containing protein n=1 Tax=Virgibacillus sp. MSJ-26 TaxID=2841522 RepID=UPI001C127614|nr:effector binding domain-containing protein [Virgibacillus sp. MSJ-26]MBU5466205.1 effector binding domain-containing protein [Virgibacillus sp. MSJ-26]